MEVHMKFLNKLIKKGSCEKEERCKMFARECSALTERLADIRCNFDAVTDPPEIDALIFEENAVLCRLEQLYREARTEGISVEIYERRK